MYILLHSADEITKYININIDKQKMSKIVSPTSVAADKRICQAHGRRVDCELKFEQLKRQNHLREQKREEREEHGNREHNYHKRKKAEPYSEFDAFARTASEDPSKHQYTIQQLRDMPKNTSARYQRVQNLQKKWQMQ